MKEKHKKVYILLTHTGTIMSILVKFFTKYDYSHAAVCLDNKLNKIYGFGRKNLYNPFLGGFVVEDKDGKFFHKFKNTKIRIYEITITKESYSKLEEVLEQFNKNYKKYRYDFWGLVSRKLKHPIQRKDYYVCTHFIAMLLEKSNIIRLNEKSEDVIPKDFEKLMELEDTKIIYEGLLRDYKNDLI